MVPCILYLSKKNDPYIPSEETPTHIHGVPKRDPTREVYRFDYQNNKWIYDKHELDPENPVHVDPDALNTHKEKIHKKGNTINIYEDQLENQLNDYIWDHSDEVLDGIK
jgi:hypothetical protein